MESKSQFADLPRLDIAYEKGGIHLNKRESAGVGNIFFEIIKQIGRKMVSGSLTSLLSFHKPIIICQPLTLLETQAFEFQNMSEFVKKARLEEDPVKKLKYIITGVISSHYRSFIKLADKTPLYPTLGETLQQKQKNGTELYAECISVDPLQVAYLVRNSDENFVMHGSGTFDASMSSPNCMLGYKKGKTVARIGKNYAVVFTNPTLQVTGLVSNTRIANYIDKITFSDKANKLIAYLTYEEDKSGTLENLSNTISGWWGKKADQKPKTDQINIVIFHCETNEQGQIINKKEVSHGSGSWLSHIEFDGELFWRLSDQFDDFEYVDQQKLLPSNAMNRKDREFLLKNDITQAEIEKNKIDEQYYKEKNLRKKGQTGQKL